MILCENCGYLNNQMAPFCEECGAPLVRNEKYQPVAKATKKTVSLANSQKGRLPIKQLLLSFGLTLSEALLAGCYYWGQHHFSKKEQLSAFITAIERQDLHQVSQLLTTNEQNFAVTPTTIKPLVQYFHDQPQQLKKVAQALSKNQKIHGLTMQKNGQHYFVFPRYQFVLTPVYLRVATNQKKVTVKINQTTIGTSNSVSYQQEYGPIAPGNYTFEAILKDANGTNVRLKETHLMDTVTAAEIVNLNFRKVAIPITSNLEEADVYVNQQKVATYHSGTQIIGPLFWSPGMKIQLKKVVNGETLTTAAEPIQPADFSEKAAGNLTLQLNFAVLTDYDVRLALEQFYQALAAVSKAPNEAAAQQFSAKYLAGKQGHPAYEELWKLLASRKAPASTAATDLAPTYEVTINQLKRLGRNTYQVDYRLQVAQASANAGQAFPQVQWIDGIKDQLMISKKDFSVSPIQFLTLDERVLNWLSTH